MFPKLQALLVPCGITHYYTDTAGVSQRHLPSEQRTGGKLSMQQIERKQLTLRTRLKRLARKTLCFSRSRLMHDLLIGLYMNRVEFGRPVLKRANSKLEHHQSRVNDTSQKLPTKEQVEKNKSFLANLIAEL